MQILIEFFEFGKKEKNSCCTFFVKRQSDLSHSYRIICIEIIGRGIDIEVADRHTEIVDTHRERF